MGPLVRNAVGGGDVRRRALDIDMRLAGAGEQRAGTRRHRTRRQVGPHVKSKDRVYSKALEHPGFADGLGPTRSLLCRLEYKQNVGLKNGALAGQRFGFALPRRVRLRAAGLKAAVRACDRSVDHAGKSQRHGHMRIMAARVHMSRRFRSRRRTRPLHDGKGVHIGADGDGGIAPGIKIRAHAG